VTELTVTGLEPSRTYTIDVTYYKGRNGRRRERYAMDGKTICDRYAEEGEC
jgi:hypothetical protein